MTLLQFIKSKLEEDTPMGDLSRDAYHDKNFRQIRTDEEKLNYLVTKTSSIASVFEEFKELFEESK
jgi:hypothetical protein